MNTIAPLNHSLPLPSLEPSTHSAPAPAKRERRQAPSLAQDTGESPAPPARRVRPSQEQEAILVDDGNLIARHSIRTRQYDLDKPTLLDDKLTLETGNTSDTIHVSNRTDGRLNVEVNGKSYIFDARDAIDEVPTKLVIKSNGGDDKIKVDADVMLYVTIEAGDGNDHVRAGGGPSRLLGGSGNDFLQLGSGAGYAEGNEGSDMMIGGSGNAILYGNNGNDWMYAGPGAASKKSHMDGGSGSDTMYAGNGHTIMNGGRGDDVMQGRDRTTFYSGKGNDTIRSNNRDDLIYAKPSDRFLNSAHAKLRAVTPSEAGKRGFNVQGTAEFKQRVEDDLELLRSSPAGQKMLAEMDAAADRNGVPVTLQDGGKRDRTDYAFNQQEPDQLDPEAPVKGYVHNGVQGAPITDGVVRYSPSSTFDAPVSGGFPITNLYHEMVHAYNGATGSFLPGTTEEPVAGEPPEDTPNIERQAVGLPTGAEPFDFDHDPLTPPTATNPAPFTENSLRKEMGLNLRNRYT
ncbi:M91 family zinc metallopeptidase [Pseudomonas sp. MF6754]|uniref:M91 family zinc metallopeptidase n=1 Tax=Pseudomonas sp. MF6754 TaxID=2797529 RepID=UPI001909D9DD|nr:M91 family zinc metallopeptidase [Pseudomonas sp. MF6754]MBK3455106.1 hemolysin [Pseudomonas sp. MF6754]